ncbi:MAG TPA: alkaline phosphatase D family protein [Solirubrobacterales bacterium]
MLRRSVGVLITSAAFVMSLGPAASADSFSLGVAAGEVSPNSAILWGHADQAGETRVEVATDAGFTHIVRSFKVQAQTANDLTVQRRVEGLQSSTRYWYRFTSGGATSDVGTFVTAPKTNDDAAIKFAWTGDYDAEPAVGQTQPFWNDFGVFGSMQAEGNDFNIALGDTIYSDSEVPGRLNPVALTVEQKWAKYRLNLGQAPLADLRGAAGFYSHWDDHEFINDFSRFESVFSSGTIDGQLLYDRGVKAFTDFAPVDYSSGDGLYRTRRWGKNLELFFLDERSFRSAKASKDGVCDNPQTGQPDLAPTAPQAVRNAFSLLIPSLALPVSQACLDAINDPNRTLLGDRQMKEFLHDVTHSNARFKVVVNELPIQQYYSLPYDRWEGYEADRQHVLSALQGVNNVVFLTTDVHATLVNDARFKTLEPGGPQNSGILDVTVGPAATATFAREINDAVGIPGAAPLIDDLFFEPQPPSGLGMLCSGIDQFSYGEVAVSSTQLTITPKDIDGNPLTTDDGACGPFVLSFQA